VEEPTIDMCPDHALSFEMTDPIALQLYTIRRELETNPERALEQVKAMSVDAVEIAPLQNGLSAGHLSKLLRSLELKAIAIHCALPVGEQTSEVVDLANEFGCSRVIWHGWPRAAAFDTVDGVHRLVEQCNEAAANAREHGLELGLHNHWWEFERLDGRFPYQLILNELNPEVFFEIDTYWIRAAGLNPADILRELGERVALLHVKDGSARKGEPMTAVGDGVMDFPTILKATSPTVQWLVVELDECGTSIWEAIQRSFEYLRDLRLAIACK
jgi:sugar phosphate isomerase/epimerase